MKPQNIITQRGDGIQRTPAQRCRYSGGVPLYSGESTARPDRTIQGPRTIVVKCCIYLTGAVVQWSNTIYFILISIGLGTGTGVFLVSFSFLFLSFRFFFCFVFLRCFVLHFIVLSRFCVQFTPCVVLCLVTFAFCRFFCCCFSSECLRFVCLKLRPSCHHGRIP